jgi:hypothetical protein
MMAEHCGCNWGKSQQDFIIQPSVARCNRATPGVNYKTTSTPKELFRCARNGDATALRLENILHD